MINGTRNGVRKERFGGSRADTIDGGKKGL